MSFPEWTARGVRVGQDPAQVSALRGGNTFTSTEVVYGVTGTEVTELPEYGVSP